MMGVSQNNLDQFLALMLSNSVVLGLFKTLFCQQLRCADNKLETIGIVNIMHTVLLLNPSTFVGLAIVSTFQSVPDKLSFCKEIHFWPGYVKWLPGRLVILFYYKK